MKDQQTKDKLASVLSRVLEQVAFVFSEPAGELAKIDPAAEPYIEISLKYSGASTGHLSLILPLSLSRQFSSGMLGIEPDPNDEADSQADAAKEIGNIVTGQLLTELFGTKAIFNVAAPEVHELLPEQFFALLENREYVCNMVENQPVIAMLTQTEVEHERQGSYR